MMMKVAIRLFFLVACFGPFAMGGWAHKPTDEQASLSCVERVARFLRNTPAIGVGEMLTFDLAFDVPTEQHVAVLSADPRSGRSRLRIFRCSGQGVETVFTLEEPDGEQWETLESFPSNGLVPGVVVWGGMEYSRTQLIVVCYTGSFSYPPSGHRVEKPGIFKVAFNGDDAMLVDLDLDYIPEVVADVESPVPTGGGWFGAPRGGNPEGHEKVKVWTYADGAYIMVGVFPREGLWSDGVRRAIEDTKRKHRAPGGAGGAGSRVPESK